MVKEVIHDPIFLGVKSEKATKEDLQVAQDLSDTLIANKDVCVGMAANMIGVHKRIIVFYFIMKVHIRPCSTRRLSKSQGHMMLKKVVFLCSVIPVNANAIRPSKCSGKSPNSKLESELSLAGRHRSFNMKLTIVMGC